MTSYDDMTKVDYLLGLLREEIPFALARFNDGELRGMDKPGFMAARGDQEITESLAQALRDSLIYEQPNYFIGISCSECQPQDTEVAYRYVRRDYQYLVSAVIFTNKNWPKVSVELPEILKKRKVLWVSGDDQDMVKLHLGCGIQPYRHYKLPTQDAWKVLDKTITYLPGMIGAGDVVMISGGPVATILAQKLFMICPDTTVIDIGSVFDPFTRGVTHRCHIGNYYPCNTCGTPK